MKTSDELVEIHLELKQLIDEKLFMLLRSKLASYLNSEDIGVLKTCLVITKCFKYDSGVNLIREEMKKKLNKLLK